MVPQLSHSLKILELAHTELDTLLKAELLNNPFLEEGAYGGSKEASRLSKNKPPSPSLTQDEIDFRLESMTKKTTLQDVLLRQLGMFTQTEEELMIGQEIIGNIDENGYLRTSLEELSLSLKNVPFKKLEEVLGLIQRFDPSGVGARSISECLLIQLENEDSTDQNLRLIVKDHLDDVAKKNYKAVAKSLGLSLEELEPLLHKILKLDPKPGRKFHPAQTQQVTPDIDFEVSDEGEITFSINNEDSSKVSINKDYKDLLSNKEMDAKTREFLKEKLQNAMNLLNAISRRHSTLRKIAQALVELQAEAIKDGLSYLKPLSLKEVARKLELHESTVCRAVMNKYAKLPYGVVAIKEFFPSAVSGGEEHPHSPNYVKKLILEAIKAENKKKPLSDSQISSLLSKEHKLKVCRRTIAKYREEIKILNSTYRKEK